MKHQTHQPHQNKQVTPRPPVRWWQEALLGLCLLGASASALAWEMTPEQRQHLRHQMREQWQQLPPPPPPGMMPPPPGSMPPEGMHRASLREGNDDGPPRHRHRGERCQRTSESAEQGCRGRSGEAPGWLPPGK